MVAIRKGLRLPIGSMTQMGHIRLGKRTEDRQPLVRNFVPLAELDQLVFGGWDIFEDNVFEAAMKAGVLEKELLLELQPELEAIKPMRAVFDNHYVKKLHGTHVKNGKSKMDLAEQLMQDMENFKKKNGCDRLVMIWCGSTEIFMKQSAVHADLASFEKGLRDSQPGHPAQHDLRLRGHQDGHPLRQRRAEPERRRPGAARAPGQADRRPHLRQGLQDRPDPAEDDPGSRLQGPPAGPRAAGSRTNILGNRDGEVLDDPESFKTKEESKLSVLDTILQPKLYPDLYGNLYHKVRINYYPPRGDNKEGWDNIDIFGWCGRPMQIKVDFLCRDSILAAPLVLDLALLLDLAKRCRACPAASRSGCPSTSRARSCPWACIRSTTCSSSRPSSRTPCAG